LDGPEEEEEEEEEEEKKTDSNPIVPPLSLLDEEDENFNFDIDYLKNIAGKHGKATPRTVFLYGCIQARDGLGLPPRMTPIIRKSRTIKINLSHQGMGDELAEVFANALVDLPEVQRIDVSDNRLSDEGVLRIVEALMDKKDLLSLNLGYNKIDGEAAEQLAHYIAAESCPLKELALSHGDIDDGECVR